MSLTDVRDRVRDSPERARSLFTVRAAISSARLSLAPRPRWLCLICSYCRARLVPFFTPRGGMSHLHSHLDVRFSTTHRWCGQTADNAIGQDPAWRKES